MVRLNQSTTDTNKVSKFLKTLFLYEKGFFYGLIFE